MRLMAEWRGWGGLRTVWFAAINPVNYRTNIEFSLFVCGANVFFDKSKQLPNFKLLMLSLWLFLLSSAPFLPLVVPGLLWLNAFWLSAQFIWATSMFLGAMFDLRTNVYNSCAVIFSVAGGYLAYVVARHVHVSSLTDPRDWGTAWDIWGLNFIYSPLLLLLFFSIWATSRWLGLSALFKTKMPMYDS